MNRTAEGTVRHTWRAGVIAGLIVAIGALGGCSSSEDSSPGGDAVQADSRADGAEAPQAAADDGVGGDGFEGEGGAADNRALIVTGSLYITVEDPIAASDRAADIVEGAGGRIDARNETAPDDRDGGSAALTMRIPENRLDDVVDDLRELGTVDHYTTEGRDVTTEVTDLAARISTLRESTERIRGLLAEAKDLRDIITLEDELAARQAQLQSLEAQQRGLDDQVSLSTIDLSLTTEPIEVVEEEDDSPKSFWDGLVSGWDALAGFVSVALVVIGVLLPWAAAAALIAFVVMALVRARRSRRERGAAASAPVSASPATAAPTAAPASPASSAAETRQPPAPPKP
ncbi:DUF4349 domain-containing protein [Demequina sp. TTPB684]|uniref:DUF4349 domain-containing protein n=1 Tax=unclassified Demequina TaxID=2620311 RepID=UPI001CF254AC|nr:MULTISPECIES: DUF4349 domain-containing protein [unclassified Demequina]MCB2411625.1 DUF4349 domain-containing protein [Demequina sp. TTPB684]UPU88284.1 DUF4349 domain-containing protein [Demequina sp. TMPB413]